MAEFVIPISYNTLKIVKILQKHSTSTPNCTGSLQERLRKKKKTKKTLIQFTNTNKTLKKQMQYFKTVPKSK